MNAVRPFSLRLFQSPRIEFENTADERRRIALGHFRGGMAKLIWDGLARIFAGCAPSLQADFKFEQFCRNS